MKSNCWKFRSALGAAILLLASSGIIAAADADREVIPVSLNAGDTYVIKNLGEDSTPAVHVVNNPNALIVHSGAPGQLVLVGADNGEWTLDVTDADGAPLTYKVDVHSITNFADPTKPGKAPAALDNPMSASDKTPAAAALDPGAGPVDSAATSATIKAAAAAPAWAGAPAPATANADAGVASTSGATAAAASSASKPTELADATSPATIRAADPAPISAASATAAAPSAPAPLTAPAFLATAPAVSTAPAASTASPIKLAEYIAPSSGSALGGTAGGPMIPSQAASSLAPLPQKFKANPLAAPYSPSEAGPSGANFLPNDVVIVMSGSSRVFDFPRRIRRISLADTEVADIQVINPYQINLIGHKEGFTTLAIWDSQGRYEERQIRVDPYGRQQVMLNAIVAEVNRGRTEQDGINWSVADQRLGLSLFNNLGGGPATSVGASGVTSTGAPFVSPAGYLPYGGTLLPLTLSNNLTYGLAGSNGNYNANAFFGYLEAHNLGKVLSEPRLLANSGEKAEFLDGGEIPIVITQALNSTIVFKQYGTSIIFVPTVVGRDEIELSVKPEVSQPDFGAGVNLFGFTVPAFVTRRAQTVVRLRDNQTLIIAGLILKTPTSTVTKVPYLGDVPWVGNLFKNTSYDNQESEMMMSVTPQIVEPLPNGGQVAQPTSVGPMNASDISTQPLSPPDASRPRF
jgi:Flp pilus assembly secretin CpaC